MTFLFPSLALLKKESEHSTRLLLPLGTARVISHTYYNPRTQLLNWNGQEKKKKKNFQASEYKYKLNHTAKNLAFGNYKRTTFLSESQFQHENTEAASNLLKFLTELKKLHSFKGHRNGTSAGWCATFLPNLQGKAFPP